MQKKQVLVNLLHLAPLHTKCVCLSVCLSHNSTAVNLVHIRLATQCTCLSQNSGDWGITGARFWKVPPKSTVTTVDFRDRARSWVLAFGRCRQKQPSPRLVSEIGGDHRKVPPKSTVATVDFQACWTRHEVAAWSVRGVIFAQSCSHGPQTITIATTTFAN